MSILFKVNSVDSHKEGSTWCAIPCKSSCSFSHHFEPQSSCGISARTLINPETKESFFKLFEMGHSASSAHHWHETKLFLDEGEDQYLLADRAFNPTKPDISKLYEEWRQQNMGADNGKELFNKLDAEIKAYNNMSGGRAKLQVFQSGVNDDCVYSSSDSEERKPPKKKKRRSQPMVIAVCTPLMCRVHENVQQAGEMVFCDATSSLDRFNTSLFIASTCSLIGGLPLGVIITSDEEQETIGQGLEIMKDILPANCFNGRGPTKGPSIIMTDDSSAERNALSDAWPD